MNQQFQLFEQLKKGEPDAQRHLYKTYAPILKGICIRYIKDKDDVSDLLQETFIKIFDKINQFNGEGSFEGWMKRITMSTCIDFLRKNKFKDNEDINDKYDFVSEENDDDEKDIITQLLEIGFNKEMLLQLMHRLNEKQRLIFNLFCIDHLSHKEIAEKLNITEVYSRKILFQAKNAIKEMLIEFVKTHETHLVK